jgi:hypothetical protein
MICFKYDTSSQTFYMKQNQRTKRVDISMYVPIHALPLAAGSTLDLIFHNSIVRQNPYIFCLWVNRFNKSLLHGYSGSRNNLLYRGNIIYRDPIGWHLTKAITNQVRNLPCTCWCRLSIGQQEWTRLNYCRTMFQIDRRLHWAMSTRDPFFLARTRSYHPCQREIYICLHNIFGITWFLSHEELQEYYFFTLFH